MADWETSESLRNGRLASKATGAAPGGPLPAGKVAPTATPMATHRCTLPFLIAVIKNSQRESAATELMKGGVL
jgi:hypothetical protein